MDKNISLKAYAKVNLLLDVLGRREDGYHELAGIMQRVSLWDEVDISVREAEESSIETEFDLPVPYHNTARRAAELYLNGAPYAVRITVRKRVPSEAGLGCASADAAAVLEGLNMVFAGTEQEKPRKELFKIGLRVGADVPFCLAGGCAVAKGVGERLSPLPVPRLDMLIVKGERGVSTGRLFAAIDSPDSPCASRVGENALRDMIFAILAGDKAGVGACMGNALQPAAEQIAPEIAEYCQRMRALGALGACMTGSGSAVVGLFGSRENAEQAKDAFADCAFAAVCSAME